VTGKPSLPPFLPLLTDWGGVANTPAICTSRVEGGREGGREAGLIFLTFFEAEEVATAAAWFFTLLLPQHKSSTCNF